MVNKKHQFKVKKKHDCNITIKGPFWITTTLIFTIAISGNIYSFLRNFGTQIDWHTDFHKGKHHSFLD